MVNLEPTNKELAALHLDLQRLQLPLRERCINKIKSHPGVLVNFLNAHSNLDNPVSAPQSVQEIITTLGHLQVFSTGRGKNFLTELSANPNEINIVELVALIRMLQIDVKKWGLLLQHECAKLSQVLRYEFLYRKKFVVEQCLNLEIGEDGAITVKETNKSDFCLIQFAIIDKDVAVLKDRLRQLEDLKSHVEVLQDFHRMKIGAWSYLFTLIFGAIALASGALLFRNGPPIFKIITTIVLLISSILMLCCLLLLNYPQKLVRQLLPAFSLTMDHLTQRVIYVINASLKESVNNAVISLHSLFEMVGNQEMIDLPASVKDFSSDILIADLIKIINDYYDFEKSRMRQIKSQDSNNYPKQCQINRLQFFPPPIDKKPNHVAISIEDSDRIDSLVVNGDSSPIRSDPTENTHLVSAAPFRTYTESSRSAAAAALSR